MPRRVNPIIWGKRLVYKVVCPNCWHSFFPEEVLFIAKHPELLGDPVAGPEEYLRFEPMRFNVNGEALDPRGFTTSDLACPRCHLQLPEGMMEVQPLFISILGSPASGKSYFLTTMSWELRTLMPQALMAFSDADPVGNSPIHDYEHTLFLNPHPDRPTEIRKTQSTDPQLHRSALISGAPVRFPVPLQFSLWPMPQHPRFAHAQRIGRIVVLYDNAGEDFLPGAVDGGSAVIQHLARSQIILALFDPTQDPRFRAECHSDDPQLTHGLRPAGQAPAVLLRQETLLKEASLRIRTYLGLAADKRIQKPLIIIVPKFDIWQDMLDASIDEEPYDGGPDDTPIRIRTNYIDDVSQRIRSLFQRLCPEFVATAEGLSELVRYIPVSSLGRSPELITRDKHSFYGIRPKDIRPKWVTVPLLYCLCKWAPGTLEDAGRPAHGKKR